MPFNIAVSSIIPCGPRTWPSIKRTFERTKGHLKIPRRIARAHVQPDHLTYPTFLSQAGSGANSVRASRHRTQRRSTNRKERTQARAFLKTSSLRVEAVLFAEPPSSTMWLPAHSESKYGPRIRLAPAVCDLVAKLS